MKTDIYNIEGKKAGSVELPESIFGVTWNDALMHQVVTSMQDNARTHVAHTKDRGEVRGGGKKPWRQKGTGQARHGSTRSPIWRHGGITFGPRSDRNYSEKINKQMRFGALASILSKKAADGEVIFVEKIGFAAPKTKEATSFIRALASGAKAPHLAGKRKNAALVALLSYDEPTIKSFRNIGS